MSTSPWLLFYTAIPSDVHNIRSLTDTDARNYIIIIIIIIRVEPSSSTRTGHGGRRFSCKFMDTSELSDGRTATNGSCRRPRRHHVANHHAGSWFRLFYNCRLYYSRPNTYVTEDVKLLLLFVVLTSRHRHCSSQSHRKITFWKVVMILC